MSYRFDHIAQQVPDIAAAVEWYRETIPGTQVLYQDESWAFIEVNGTRVAFVRREQHPGHLAWRVDAAELERLAARHGKKIIAHRDRTRSIYLEAPGEQWIELIDMADSPWAEIDTRGAAPPGGGGAAREPTD